MEIFPIRHRRRDTSEQKRERDASWVAAVERHVERRKRGENFHYIISA